MPLTAQLDKSPGDRQRNTLARPTEHIVQQRAAAISAFAHRDQAWAEWGERTGASLSITATVLDVLVPAVLHPNSGVWSLDVSLSAGDYDGLQPGIEVSLRLVQTLEQTLLAIAATMENSPPTHLGRTKSEAAWLAQGNVDPGPGTSTPVRIRKPPGPMPEHRFWALIESTTDDRSGAFRLGWQQADRFTSRMRLLIAELDSPDHLAAAQGVLGWVSDDVWQDVRAWVVSRGQDVYAHSVVQPAEIRRLLASLDSEDELSLGEELLYLEGHE